MPAVDAIEIPDADRATTVPLRNFYQGDNGRHSKFFLAGTDGAGQGAAESIDAVTPILPDSPNADSPGKPRRHDCGSISNIHYA